MIDRLVPRKVPHDPATRSEAVTTAILGLVPRVEPSKAEALIAVPGQGEQRRVIVPVRTYNQKQEIQQLFVTGDCSWEPTWEDYTKDRLHHAPYHLARRDGLVVQPDSHAEHTKEQADWLAHEFRMRGTASVVVSVVDYHLVRLYCALLASMIDVGIDNKTAILPWPIATPPDETIPGLGMSPWGAMPGEIARRQTYQNIRGGHEIESGQQPDCATPIQVLEYLSWLHKHPSLQ